MSSKLKVEIPRETFVDFLGIWRLFILCIWGHMEAIRWHLTGTIGKYARMLNGFVRVSEKICTINCTLFSISMGRKSIVIIAE